MTYTTDDLIRLRDNARTTAEAMDALINLAPAPLPVPSPIRPLAKLILAPWFGNTIPTPQFIRDNAGYLDSLPFDGIVAYLRRPDTTDNLTIGVQGATPVSYELAMDVLAPLRGLGPAQNLKHNFGLVMGGSPPDFFDDWTSVIADWTNLARALKDSNFAGIMFDNEQYFGPWGDWTGASMKYPAKTLGQYQAQARVRGRQIVNAVKQVFTGIHIITLHGPSVSEPKAPAALLYPNWSSGNELLGPFFAGMMDGADLPDTKIVDGGELYGLRSFDEFMKVRDWNKITLPIVSSFIPDALKAVYSQRVSIGFGIMDHDDPASGRPMNLSLIGPTLKNALAVADDYCWLYCEAQTFLLPPSAGGASQAWVDAVRGARG